jgi:hypothetical protein
MGHIGKECPTWAAIQRERKFAMVCTKCKRRGHQAAQCTEQEKYPTGNGKPQPPTGGAETGNP